MEHYIPASWGRCTLRTLPIHDMFRPLPVSLSTLRASVVLLLWVLPVFSQASPLPTDGPSSDQPPSASSDPRPPAKEYRDWLEQVDPIITALERQVFMELGRNHHRDAFIRQFWKVRDPYPKTARNELKELWDERLYEIETEFGGLNDDRSRILLVHGEPAEKMAARCTETRVPVEVWIFNRSDVLNYGFSVVFLRRSGVGYARLWMPGTVSLDDAIAMGSSCINGERVGRFFRGLASQSNYAAIIQQVIAKPKPPSEEWVSTFAAYTTEIPGSAATFKATVDYSFLGRHQSRTLMQGSIRVHRDQVGVGDFANYRSYDFQLTGEILQGGELFESFRYKFGFSADDPDLAEIPLAFQRLLRPGTYDIFLKLEDLNAVAFYGHRRSISVPTQIQIASLADDRGAESLELFREANEAISRESTAIRLIAPIGSLHSGRMRFDTITTGKEIEQITFFLDDQKILTKTRPPFNVEIDLGPYPRLRKLRAEASAGTGRIVAEDEILLNAGEDRFAVRLVEPRRGGMYRQSLQARADVEVPAGETLERVEFFLNEAPVATLYQPPFTQPIRLPALQEIAYVRAVAHLVDGNSTEDLVFINSPDYLEEIDVQFVELYAAALDAEGRLIDNLQASDFHVSEDGTNQKVVRFSRVEDLPIHTIILLDNSASMVGALRSARHAALSYFNEALTSRDRAAVITFNRFPELAVKFTNDSSELGSALQGLSAEGQTALYDSLMFSLYYFTGIKGQRAVLLLSDGQDEVSRYDYPETLEYARRAGVTIYTIGLKVNSGGARKKLVELASETGGRSYFITDTAELSAVYALVQADLRSQYLLAYQSSNTSRDGRFRSVELKVDRPNTQVRTLSGYYP